MRASRVITAVDTHTEGMPTRVVTGGIGVLEGSTMIERMRHLVSERDDLRTLLMYEPRGHSAMSGSILQPPLRPDADVGVVFIEVSGSLPMCGHGTIGTATVLVETGMVEVTEPVTTIRFDTPAGLVVAEVEVAAGKARRVSLRNVVSYLHAENLLVDVPGLGPLRLDVSYGGNFYAILPAATAGMSLSPDQHDGLVERGLTIMAAVNAQHRLVHPQHPEITDCRHVLFTAAGNGEVTARGAVVIHPGWIDRSPCGTGTSARMAQLHAQGALKLHERFVHASLLDTRFEGELVGEEPVGDCAGVRPVIRGRAWITGLSSYLLDPDDPFPAGFLLGQKA